MDEHHGSQDSELKFLNRLSIEELETLLRLSGDPADVEMLFDAIAEEVVAREQENNTGRLPDVNSAWEELLARYSQEQERPGSMLTENAALPDGSTDTYCMERKIGRTPQVSFRRIVRTAATVVATIVLSLALMVGAQAAGADVFGALARWTDETFHFETWSAELTHCEALHDAIQDVLETQGISGEFAPTWYPNGYNIASVQTSEDSLGLSIEIALLSESGRTFFVRLDQYNRSEYIDPQTFEIDAQSVEEYTSNGRTFFIFINDNSITASWSDGRVLQRIWGSLTVRELKTIVDSIGGK